MPIGRGGFCARPVWRRNCPMAEFAEADFFLGRQLRLRQLAHGHRAGTDAALLAAAAPAHIDGLALDVGAGVGAAGLALARLRPGTHLRP